MNIDGKPYRTIWLSETAAVEIIDQTRLPHRARDRHARDDGGRGARDPHHAGARRAADRRHGRLRRCLALREDPSDEALDRAIAPSSPSSGRPPSICAGRSTRCAPPCATCRATSASPPPTRAPPRSATRMSRPTARIGEHGLELIEAHAAQEAAASGQHPHPLQRRLARLRRLGHGARADLPGATTRASPLHVWVDETRPRNQGASLTAFELGAHGVPHTHHRRQRRRAPDAAGAGRSLHRRHRPRHRATATSPTRSAPI